MSRHGSIERFLGVVGLPRSGTTLLTALLDAHSAVGLYYEPFNSAKKQRPAVPSDLASFCDAMTAQYGFPLAPGTRVAGFKETTILPEAAQWAVDCLAAVSAALPTRVVWILRDPVHCLLSKIDGARKWWGYPEATFSRDSFEGFLRQSEPSLRVLDALVRRHHGIVIRYEALVESPERWLEALMRELDLPYEPGQLEFHREGARPERVMGDPDLSRDPQPVTAGKRSARQEESAAHQEIVDALLAREEFRWIRDEFARLDALAPLTAY